MKYHYSFAFVTIIVSFLQSTLSDSATIVSTNSTSRLEWKRTKLFCKNFKCPPVEDLLCIRMRSKKIGSKTKEMYMVLLNKCELEYIKCHQGFQATVVSMKYCGYDDKLYEKGRVKRSIRQGTVSFVEDDTELNKLKKDETASEIATEDETGEKKSKEIKNKDKIKFKDIENDNNNSHSGIGKDIGDNDDDDTSNIRQDNDGMEKDEVGDEIEKDMEKEEYDNENNMKSDKDTNPIKIEEGEGNDHVEEKDKIYTDTQNDDNKSLKKDNNLSDNPTQATTYEVLGCRDEKAGAEFLLDYDLNAPNEGVDFKEYVKGCPSFCPAREVMICSRCKDGIYRTFMSVCHLRMFNCAHPDEKAELVSRYPCVLSAPYLAEAPAPKGRVAEPGDVDEVLRFIRCRQKHELGQNTNDPRCDFNSEKNTKNELISNINYLTNSYVFLIHL